MLTKLSQRGWSLSLSLTSASTKAHPCKKQKAVIPPQKARFAPAWYAEDATVPKPNSIYFFMLMVLRLVVLALFTFPISFSPYHDNTTGSTKSTTSKKVLGPASSQSRDCRSLVGFTRVHVMIERGPRGNFSLFYNQSRT